MNKFELRKIQKNIRKSLNIKELSEKILDKLFALPEFVSAENIFTYISFGSEINTYRILNLKSKNIFVPKIIDNSMIMVKYDENHLVENKYGILEPLSNVQTLPTENDVIIVPALACDENFNRLGYGGGYYDKYLKNTNSVKIVLLPDRLFLNEIPADIYDQKVDIIITEGKIIKRHKWCYSSFRFF